jgi:hypothetical protein
VLPLGLDDVRLRIESTAGARTRTDAEHEGDRVVGAVSAAVAHALGRADVIPCNEVIDATPAPPAPWRPTLDAVALPPRGFQLSPVERGYSFSKMGLLVRAGATVEIGVPEGASHRLDWTWSHKLSAHLRIAGCRGAGEWLVFAGGIYVTEPACVEIIVRTEGREETARLALGAACEAGVRSASR